MAHFRNIDTWIGANDKSEEGAWIFSDGTSYLTSGITQVTMDGPGEQDCARLNAPNVVRDWFCSKEIFFVCMVDALDGKATGWPTLKNSAKEFPNIILQRKKIIKLFPHYRQLLLIGRQYVPLFCSMKQSESLLLSVFEKCLRSSKKFE